MPLLPVSKQHLIRLIQEMRNYNVFPVFLERFLFNVTSEEYPIRVALQPLLQEAIGHLLRFSPEELGHIHSALSWYWQERINLDLLQKYEEETLSKTALYVLIVMISEQYSDFRSYLNGSDFIDSIVRSSHIELEPHFDDDHLLRLNASFLRPTENAIYLNNTVIHYHQFLRRGFHSNPNFDFLRALLGYKRKYPSHQVAVAIDHYRLGLRKWFGEVFEKDYWHGRPFSWNDLDDPHKVGLAIHGRSNPPTSLDIPLSRTEFFWSFNEGIHPKRKVVEKLKTLQIEEVYFENPTDMGNGLVIARYLHSIRDIDTQSFYHLDGAVKIYELETYPDRFRSKMTDTYFRKKMGYYIKLFRIDSRIEDKETGKLLLDEPIPEHEWAELIALFFKQNEMILEYFGDDSTVSV